MTTTELKPLYKVGDKVKVIDKIWGHGFEIGDTLTVSDIHHISKDYLCNDGKDEWWLSEEELELIPKN